MDYYYRPSYRIGFGGGITPAVKALILINGAVFLLQFLVGGAFNLLFALTPRWLFTKFYIWQLGTYMFLHGGFFHILFNMFMLWMFGCEVERHWGSREFVKYYLICGVGAGVFHVLFSYNNPVVGASGAVLGVLAAFAVMFPDQPLMFFPFFITLKAKYWIMIFAGISLLSGVLGTQRGIAHFAHLGGMLVGYLYLKLDWRLSQLGEFIRTKREERRLMAKAKRRREIQKLKQQVDAILDKINEVGYENLTEQEKRLLQEASHILSQEKEI